MRVHVRPVHPPSVLSVGGEGLLCTQARRFHACGCLILRFDDVRLAYVESSRCVCAVSPSPPASLPFPVAAHSFAITSCSFLPFLPHIGSPNQPASIPPAPGRTSLSASSSSMGSSPRASPAWKTSTTAPKNAPSASYATWCSTAQAAVGTRSALNAICRCASRRGPLLVLTATTSSSEFSTVRTTKRKWWRKSWLTSVITTS